MGRIAIVEGVRTPFVKSWTLFEDLTAERLGAICVRELLERSHLNPFSVDEVILGCVAQPVEAINIARVVSLYAGIPKEKRGYTVSRNCASGFESITSGFEKIRLGLDEIVIAGGVESMTQIPLFFTREMTKFLVRLKKAKNFKEKMGTLFQMRPRYLKPVQGLLLGLTDPVCGLNMGETAEVLAKEFGVSRREQDEFALTSHERALASREKLREEIFPVICPPTFERVVEEDNGPRENQSLDALSSLKPFFERETGTVTAGNSCQVTDGACALLLMKEEKAQEMGYSPLGYIRAYAYVGVEPRRMGLGPAYAIPIVLKRGGVPFREIELFEINEAFAAQVISCLRLLSSKSFQDSPGEIPLDRLNVNGGAIAIGHPVGVSGSRLVLTLLMEMRRRNSKFGLASLCVGGGQGGSILLER